MRLRLATFAALFTLAVPAHAASTLTFSMDWQRDADESMDGEGLLTLDDGTVGTDGSTVFSITGISGAVRSIYLGEVMNRWAIVGLSEAHANRVVRDAGGAHYLAGSDGDRLAGLSFFIDGGPGFVSAAPGRDGTFLFFGEVGGNGRFTLEAAGASVPEPASWAMMIAGFGLAGAAIRRRARTAVPA